MEVSNVDFIQAICPLLFSGHKVRLRVKGNSMRPILKDGRDQVVLVAARSIKEGDLVLAQVQTGCYMLHRVIHKDGKRLILMGDGNLTGTECCLCTDVVGKVIMLIRKGRWIRTDGFLFWLYSIIWMQLNPLKRYLLVVYKLMRGTNGKRK